MRDVGEYPSGGEKMTGAASLHDAYLGEPDVDPSGEAVLGVPRRLAVAEQYERANHRGSFAGRNSARLMTVSPGPRTSASR